MSATHPRGSENGNRYSPTGREVLTGVTRQLIDVTAPRPEQMDIRDIARSLSRQERFTGHCPLRPSVAAHSLASEHIAGRLMLFEAAYAYIEDEPAARRAVLMHDASEHLVSDLNGAVKKELRAKHELYRRSRMAWLLRFKIGQSRFDELEDLAEAAIVARFNCSPAGFELLVHEADCLACSYEMAYDGWCEEAAPPLWLYEGWELADIYALGDDEAAQRFVERAAELGMA